MSEIEPLSKKLGKLLIERGWSITTAESCTGGGISTAITETAGSSAYFNRSFVTYSNEAKSEMLGVPIELINEHGAVSEQVVETMALGALCRANANVAVAVSGIAGPGGGSDDKPVGTVYLAVAIQYILDENVKSSTSVYRLQLTGTRKDIREETIKLSINKVLSLI